MRFTIVLTSMLQPHRLPWTSQLNPKPQQSLSPVLLDSLERKLPSHLQFCTSANHSVSILKFENLQWMLHTDNGERGTNKQLHWIGEIHLLLSSHDPNEFRALIPFTMSRSAILTSLQPPEVWKLVLSFIEDTSELYRCSLVCSVWNSLMYELSSFLLPFLEKSWLSWNTFISFSSLNSSLRSKETEKMRNGKKIVIEKTITYFGFVRIKESLSTIGN